jgi:hypothetical protein
MGVLKQKPIGKFLRLKIPRGSEQLTDLPTSHNNPKSKPREDKKVR